MEAVVDSFLSDPEGDQQALMVVNTPLQGVSIPLPGQTFRPSIDQMVAAWLHAMYNISSSSRTHDRYARYMEAFRDVLRQAKTDLDGDPVLIATLMQGWAPIPFVAMYGGKSAPVRTGTNEVSGATYNLRVAAISSFYIYAGKRRWLDFNPMIMVDKRKKVTKDWARSLPDEEVQLRLSRIDRSTLQGKRDYAILSLGFCTGRRKAELHGVRWGDIRFDASGRATVLFRRTKGGEQMEDQLEDGVRDAILDLVRSHYGNDLKAIPSDAPLWINYSCQAGYHGQPMGYERLRHIWLKHMGSGKVHLSRHTFAVGMERAGAPISVISQRLGHKNIATTSDYMKRDHIAENPYSGKLVAAFGIGNAQREPRPDLEDDGRILTKSQRIDKAIREHPDMSNVQLASLLGVVESTVQRRHKLLGLSRPVGSNQFTQTGQ